MSETLGTMKTAPHLFHLTHLDILSSVMTTPCRWPSDHRQR